MTTELLDREDHGSINRVIVFAHFDPLDQVDAYVLHYLKALSEIGRIVFVSTSALSERDLAAVRQIACFVATKPNVGYDFMSWQRGIEIARASGLLDDSCDELIICNDSVYAPLFPLEEMFQAMETRSCHYWGITDSAQPPYGWHLQSYFLVFRKPVLKEAQFWSFWEDIVPVSDKMEIVARYEVGLAHMLGSEGFKGEAYFTAGAASWQAIDVVKSLSIAQLQNIEPYCGRDLSGLDLLMTNYNASISYWRMQMLCRLPTLKVMMVRDNPAQQDISDLYQMIETTSDYDPALIINHMQRVRKKPAKGVTKRGARGGRQGSKTSKARPERLAVG